MKGPLFVTLAVVLSVVAGASCDAQKHARNQPGAVAEIDNHSTASDQATTKGKQLETTLAVGKPKLFNPKPTRLVRVIDGDTLVLLVDKKEQPIHLAGIDAPELKQRYGKEAKKALSDRISGERISVEVVGKDRYNRTHGIVVVPSRRPSTGPGIPLDDLSVWLLENGHAWNKCEDNERLADPETEAREARRGLWTVEKPVPPWKWRKIHGKEDNNEKAANTG